MNKMIIALVLFAVLIFGCTQQGQPTATPTAKATTAAAAIGPEFEQQAAADAEEIAAMGQLTKELDQAGMQVTNEDLNSLG